MLKQLKIWNFQSHKKVNIKLHSGVNVITGQSEAGKSAIIRSIRWVVRNRPSGKSVIRKGETTAKVKLIFDNGIIKKIRHNNSVRYLVDNTSLTAIKKNEVPDEVLNVAKLDERNFQTQHNPYFLLVKSPGEVARELNKLAGISIIDKLFSTINSESRKTKEQILTLEDSIPETKKQIEKLELINNIEPQVNRYGKLLKKRQRLIQTIEQLEQTIEALQNIAEKEKIENERLGYGDEIELLRTKAEKVKYKQEKYNSVCEAIAQLKTVNTLIKTNQEAEDQCRKQKNKIMSGLQQCPLCNSIITKKEGNNKDA